MADSDTPDTVRVLLIEDDVEFAEMYRLRLEADDYAVEWASNGRDGLRLVDAWRPDLIFLDVRMPEMDGLEVLRTLRQNPATAAIPVVVLTNYDDEKLRSEGERLGILEWRTKMHATPAGISAWIKSWSSSIAEAGRKVDGGGALVV